MPHPNYKVPERSPLSNTGSPSVTHAAGEFPSLSGYTSAGPECDRIQTGLTGRSTALSALSGGERPCAKWPREPSRRLLRGMPSLTSAARSGSTPARDSGGVFAGPSSRRSTRFRPRTPGPALRRVLPLTTRWMPVRTSPGQAPRLISGTGIALRVGRQFSRTSVGPDRNRLPEY